MTKNAPDWSKLKTDKGDASWVPGALDALASPLSDDYGPSTSPRNRAFRGLSKRLFKNGQWLSAAPATVEAVLDLALRDDVPERHRLLALAAKLVALNPAPYLVTGFDLSDPATKKTYGRGTGKKVHAPLRERADEVIALLGEDEPRVRSGAAYLILFRGAELDATATAIAEALANEEDAHAKVTLTLVLGLVGREAHQDLLAKGMADPHPAVAGAATLASGAPLDEEARARLVALIRSAPFEIEEVPIDGGRLDMLVARTLEAREDAGKKAAADLLVAALAEPHPLGDEWAGGVLALEFALGPNHDPKAHFIIKHTYYPADHFSDEQRDRLVALSHHPWAAPFASYGVPFKLRDRRRWLGMDEPGVLESEHELTIEGQTHRWPLWRWLQGLQRGPKAKERFDILAEHLPPEVVLGAMADAATNAYGLRVLPATNVAERARALDDGGLAWARGLADHLAEAVARDAGASWNAFQTGAAIKPGHAVAAVALEIKLEHGDAIEERHDPLVPVGHRALMEALTPKRREAVVLRHLDLLSRAPDICNASASFVLGPMAETLPLCPKPKIAVALKELASKLEACERVTYEDREALNEALDALS